MAKIFNSYFDVLSLGRFINALKFYRFKMNKKWERTVNNKEFWTPKYYKSIIFNNKVGENDKVRILRNCDFVNGLNSFFGKFYYKKNQISSSDIWFNFS